jgi:hypothetical protein
LVLIFAAMALGCEETHEANPSDMDTDVGDMGSDVDFDMAPTARELGLPGEFNVGYRNLEFTYDTLPGSSRTITVHIWYPTQDLDGVNPRYINVFPDPVSLVDATLAETSGQFPLHVSSHGDRGFGGSSSRIFHHFASHGWVVIAPDHQGNMLNDNIQPRPIPLYHWRATDISASLDFMEGLQGDDLSGKVDTSRVLLSGHSYGGFMCWPLSGASWNMEQVRTACEDAGNPEYPCTEELFARFEEGHRDPRIVAAIPMAGVISETWFGNGFESVEIPIMAMSGTEDPIGQQEQWDRVNGVDFTWLDLEGACHQSWALGGCQALPDEEGDPLINRYALAFGMRHVTGDDAADVRSILEGEEIPAKVQFLKKE